MQTDMKKRKFTKEQKLQIIKEASEQGVNTTLEKHGIYFCSLQAESLSETIKIIEK
ncbi:MAG: transposase [Bacteroidales bacterium]